MRKIIYKDVKKDYKHIKRGIRRYTLAIRDGSVEILLSKSQRQIAWGFKYDDYETIALSRTTEEVYNPIHSPNKDENINRYNFYNYYDFYNKRGIK